VIEELSTHLGSTGLMVVAVALLWWRASAAEKSVDALLEKSNDHGDRISRIEGRLED